MTCILQKKPQIIALTNRSFMKSQVLIFDYGSQYTQLIARAVRELGVYCQIVPGTISYEKYKALSPKVIILSGSPSSVRAEDGLRIDPKIIRDGIPVFGICYGMQLIASELGGVVSGWGQNMVTGSSATVEGSCDGIREFGAAKVVINNPCGPFACFAPGSSEDVWMSHGDKVTKAPEGFVPVASSVGSPIAAFANEKAKIFGVQFHPELKSTVEKLHPLFVAFVKACMDYKTGLI